jgi:hypothetical protein
MTKFWKLPTKRNESSFRVPWEPFAAILLGMATDSFDDVWELAEYSVREARVLRSFLEYLRLEGDSQEKKQEKLMNWKCEVGLQLGNPKVTDEASQLFQTLRVLPQGLRSVLVQKTLADAHSIYFGQSSGA